MAAMRPLVRRAVQLVTRRMPLYSGQYHASQHRLALRLTSADELVWTRLREGPWILVNVNDVIGRTVYFCADHDPKIAWVCRRVLREGDCCVDVGAHMGAVALVAAQRVGSRGVVHAFEPQPALAEMLGRSAARNGYDQLRVHAVALSDRDGVRPLYVPAAGNTGVATFDDEFAAGREALSVPVRRAGACFRELGIPHVRLLKLDVEHHEEAFLAGAEEVLGADPPDVVLFESHDRGTPFWERPTVAKLDATGYRIHRIPKSLGLPRPEPLRRPESPRGPGWDFLAVHARACTPALRRSLRLAD